MGRRDDIRVLVVWFACEPAEWCARHDAGMVRKPVDPATTEARQRHATAAAELMEIRLAEKRNELVPRDAAEAVWQEECAKIKSRLMQIPGRLAERIAIMQTAAEIERAIDEEVRSALSELSAG